MFFCDSFQLLLFNFFLHYSIRFRTKNSFTIIRILHKIEHLFKGERMRLKISVTKLGNTVLDNELLEYVKYGVPIPNLSRCTVIYSFPQIVIWVCYKIVTK